MKKIEILSFFIFLSPLCPLCPLWQSSSSASPPDGERWWGHVKVLADDRLEGRQTGSPGHRKAAEYVAKQYEALGLKPAGTDGFLQPVKFQVRRIDEEHSRVELVRPGGMTALKLGDDAMISVQVDPAHEVDAGLVFVGYGLGVPDAGVDDFRGLDVKGKVAVYLSGAPPSLPGPLAAHAQATAERAAALKKAGAIGAIRILNPRAMDIPWARFSLARAMPAMTPADPAMDESAGLTFGLAVNPARAEALFEGSGHPFSKILEADRAGRPLPRFELPARLKATVAVTRSEVTSENVVAVLPGSDPKLKDEYVVLSAHLDHLGVGAPIKGDPIYNGAMDNASGVACLLDVAAILKETKARPRRSILFLAVTGEEKGLQGSRYFANAPTVDPKSIVANINNDMFLPLFPLKSVIVFGLDESDLKADVIAAAKEAGVGVLPDPEPKRNVFIRSDQYSFIRKGVPALMMKVGHEPGSKEEATVHDWLTNRYHAPSDDLDQPVDRAAAGAYDALTARLLVRIADRDERPRWNDSSFFKRYAR